jgi:glutamyl/glutaminyl-tRNA synthetase
MKQKTECEQLIRIILTGNEVGPNIYQLMEAMGKERVLERIKYFQQVMALTK